MEAKSSSIGHAVFRCPPEPRCTREDGKTASSQVLEGVSRGIAWQLQAPDSTALKIILLKVVKQSRKRETTISNLSASQELIDSFKVWTHTFPLPLVNFVAVDHLTEELWSALTLP